MTKENTNLQKDNMDLRSKVEKLKAKIASLKKRAEKAPTATADTGQDSVNDAGQDGCANHCFLLSCCFAYHIFLDADSSLTATLPPKTPWDSPSRGNENAEITTL